MLGRRTLATFGLALAPPFAAADAGVAAPPAEGLRVRGALNTGVQVFDLTIDTLAVSARAQDVGAIAGVRVTGTHCTIRHTWDSDNTVTVTASYLGDGDVSFANGGSRHGPAEAAITFHGRPGQTKRGLVVAARQAVLTVLIHGADGDDHLDFGKVHGDIDLVMRTE